MGPTLAGKFIFIGSCDSDEGLNADTVVDGKWFPSDGLQSIPGARTATGTCLWDCPCWGEGEGWDVTHHHPVETSNPPQF